MRTLHRLKSLIEQSKNWASAERSRVLFARVAETLQDTLGMDAGMFCYRKRLLSIDEGVSNVWGLPYADSVLTDLFAEESWSSDEMCTPSECWLPVSDMPSCWRQMWEEAGIQYVGSWPITIQHECVAEIVVGNKSLPSSEDTDLMAGAASYVSLILEMFILRRVAEHASHRDPLTAIHNRRGFMERVNDMTLDLNRPLIIAILDINNFKGINDTRGHLEGDKILNHVARVLETRIGHHGACGRFGGDEFVMAFQTDNPFPDADEIANEVSQWFQDQEFHVSVGCALWGPDGVDLTDCLSVADKRLYTWKANAVSL